MLVSCQFERKPTGVPSHTTLHVFSDRPPGLPPPPSPPPRPDAPPGLLAPPIPPIAVDFDTRLQQLRSEAAALEVAVVSKRNEIGGACVPSATNTCGRSNAAAPDPWIDANGEHCAGYETREALEGSFCGHWGSPVNSTTRACTRIVLMTNAVCACFAEQRRGC